MQELAALLQEQVLNISFEYYKSPFPKSVAAICLSNGRSVLRDAFPLLLPLQPTAGGPVERDALRAVAESPDMDAVRDYLLAAVGLELQVPEEVGQAG